MANSSSTPNDAPGAEQTPPLGESGSKTPSSAPHSQKRPGTIVRVSYGATVNIGEYETIRFDLSADVGPEDKWQDVLERLRALVDRQKERVKKEGY